jgi:chromate transport protein ChrA
MTSVLMELARTFAMLSLVSIGGINVLLPEIRRQVVDVHGWMTDAAFAHTFAIASAAPGPNVIVVSLRLAGRRLGRPPGRHACHHDPVLRPGVLRRACPCPLVG